MRALLALLLVASACTAAFGSDESPGKGLPDYGIHLLIPVAEKIEIDEAGVVAHFKKRGVEKVVCSHVEKWSDPKKGIKKYLVGNGANNLVLTVMPEPLGKELTEMCITMWSSGDEKEAEDLRKHKSFIGIEYQLGLAKPMDRVAFTAKLLRHVLKRKETLGYLNASAQTFVFKKRVGDVLAKKKLETADLFRLFVGFHVVDLDAKYDVHSHGLGAFELPDLRKSCWDEKQVDAVKNQLSEIAVYMIRKGVALKPGETLRFAEEKKVYRIRAVEPDEEHPFGKFGAVEIRE
jgi:hypothetical protein